MDREKIFPTILMALDFIAVALLTLAAWLFGIVWFLYKVVG